MIISRSRIVKIFSQSYISADYKKWHLADFLKTEFWAKITKITPLTNEQKHLWILSTLAAHLPYN